MRCFYSLLEKRPAVVTRGFEARVGKLGFVGHGFSRAEPSLPVQGLQPLKSGANFALQSILWPLVAGMLLLSSAAAWAQAPNYKGVGRAPTQDEIRAWDDAIGPAGKELPPGSGNAKDGAEIFATKCALCHGPGGEGSTLGPRLVGGKGTLKSAQPVLTVGSYWPFATTIYDYVRRAMPRGQEGSLQPDELYSLTAFLLFKNDIIKETDVIDAQTLPKVQMPNRNGFIPQQLEDIHDIKKRGCRRGHCP
jgi:cytochrome c